MPGYVASRSATATKTDTPLIRTPQSITVVGAQQIGAQRSQTVAEALRDTPGVYYKRYSLSDNQGTAFPVACLNIPSPRDFQASARPLPYRVNNQ